MELFRCSHIYLNVYADRLEALDDKQAVLAVTSVAWPSGAARSGALSANDWFDPDNKHLVENLFGGVLDLAIRNVGSLCRRIVRPVVLVREIKLGRELSYPEYEWLAAALLVTARRVSIVPTGADFKIGSDERGYRKVVAKRK